MIFILIPIFNEEKSIPFLYDELTSFQSNEKIFYVFSDDGSTDQSVNFIHTYFKNQNYIVLGDGQNYGPGNAFNIGFEWILKNSTSDYDKIVTMEADTTSDITILSNMLHISNIGYHLVLASVYAQSGGFDKTSFFRKIISFFANMFFRTFFDVKVLTLSSFYRVYHIELIKCIKYKYQKIITEKGFTCMLEILLKAIHCNAQVIEVPMVLKSEKRQGKSKMKIMKTTWAYFKLFFNKKKFLK